MQKEEKAGHGQFRSKTIDLFRITLIILMVSIHVPWMVDPILRDEVVAAFTGGGWPTLPFDPVQHVMLWLRLGLAGGAVSALTIISAWLTIASLERRGALNVAHAKLQALMKPYLGWCLMFAFVFVVVTGNMPRLGAVFGIGRWPLNFPLHFLLDLFISTLILLVLYPLLRGRPWAALAFAFLLGGYALYGGSGAADFGANTVSLLPRATILFLFFVGVASCGLYKRLFRSPERLAAWPMIGGLVVLTVGFSYVKLASNMLMPQISPLAAGGLFLVDCVGRLSGGLLILMLVMRAMLWRPVQVERKMAFRIFCSHAIALLVLTETGAFTRLGSDDLLVYCTVYGLAVGFGLLVHFGMEWAGRRRASVAARQPMIEG